LARSEADFGTGSMIPARLAEAAVATIRLPRWTHLTAAGA
jgi:hypothetical protein